MKCLYCGNATKNNKFCSQSCAASYNNKRSPKKSRSGTCIACGTTILTSRKFCSDCWQTQLSSLNNATLASLSTKAGSRNSYSSSIRIQARNIAKRQKKLENCAICGYSKHVECCHIKAVKNFPPSTLVSEVNQISNLIGLCRNHHWELDHGLLSAILAALPTELRDP